jgi:hypothetical protein
MKTSFPHQIRRYRVRRRWMAVPAAPTTTDPLDPTSSVADLVTAGAGTGHVS